MGYYYLSGAGIPGTLGASGASSAGLGGRGGCGGYLTCRLKRNLPYGDLYKPTDYGSGGAEYNGGTGNLSLIARKVCRLSSRPFLTQNGLYSHRKWQEA